MSDDNRLTQKLMNDIVTRRDISLRDLIDEYLEKAWNDGYSTCEEDMTK